MSENPKISKDKLLYLPLIFLSIGVLKFLVGAYYYPQQDNIIYLTFRDAARYPENFARDLFAQLHQTHFDFLWPILQLMPDTWFWEPGVIILSIVFNTLFIASLYLVTFLVTKKYWFSFLPLAFFITPKYLQGFGMFTTGFMHRVIVFCLLNLALALYLKNKNALSLALIAVCTYLYPPLIYFVWPIVALAGIYELGFSRAFKGGIFSLLLIAPLILVYYQHGVFSGLLGKGIEVDWKPYFLINLESIFTITPFSLRKLRYLLSYLGMILVCWFVVKSLLPEIEEEKRLRTLISISLIISLFYSLITYCGLELAVKLQLIRMSRFVILLALIGLTPILMRVWESRSAVQKLAVLLSGLSGSYLAPVFGVLSYFQSRKTATYVFAASTFLFVLFTHSLRIPKIEVYKQTPWADVAQYAKENIETDSLTLIPPSGGLLFCEVDSNVTFRFLAQRSTTLKLSDGVEAGYNKNFAKIYIDYVNKVHEFLRIKPDFSSACGFRSSVRKAWRKKSLIELFVWANEFKANYILVGNFRSKQTGFKRNLQFNGQKYSLLKVPKI